MNNSSWRFTGDMLRPHHRWRHWAIRSVFLLLSAMHMSSPDTVPCVWRSIFLCGHKKMLLIDFAIVVILRVVDFIRTRYPRLHSRLVESRSFVSPQWVRSMSRSSVRSPSRVPFLCLSSSWLLSFTRCESTRKVAVVVTRYSWRQTIPAVTPARHSFDFKKRERSLFVLSRLYIRTKKRHALDMSMGPSKLARRNARLELYVHIAAYVPYKM